VFAGSDFASNEGPMYSPKVFHELLLPGLKKITEVCHKHGMYYLFASDGNLWPVADDLFGESGVDGYFEIDRRAGMDLGKLRDRFPNLTLIGNISSHTLHLGTKEQVIEEVLSCVKVAEKYGGVIIGVSNYIMPKTPEENIMALLDTVRKYR
jgi:uroporphyrinogen decarboxylase